jgi:hypothetical protein
LPLSLAAPGFIIACNWFEMGFAMRAEDYVVMSAVFVFLAGSAGFASVTGWWVRKVGGEITDAGQSAAVDERASRS